MQTSPAEAVPGFLEDTIASIIAFLPRLVGAVVILVIGWIVGAVLGGIVSSIADRAGVDDYARGTAIGRMSGSSNDALSSLLGKITSWYVYLLAVLAAADALAIPILSEWIARAVSYLPEFIAGVLIIIGGFILADIISDVISRSLSATANSSYTAWFSDGVRVFLYFTAIVIGLDTMGVEVELLYIFARALMWGLAVGLALALGIGFGWGSRNYIDNHINQWTSQAKQKAPEPQSQSVTPGDDD